MLVGAVVRDIDGFGEEGHENSPAAHEEENRSVSATAHRSARGQLRKKRAVRGSVLGNLGLEKLRSEA